MPDKQLELGQDDDFLALQNAWDQSLEVLSSLVNKPSFESWVKDVKPISIEDDCVVLGTASSFAKMWLEQKYLDTIRDILSTNLGMNVRVIIKHIEKEVSPLLQSHKQVSVKPATRRSDIEPITLPLNSRYTFDSFVVGKTNRLANACSIAVAENPGTIYNPLFIYGGAGLGKTHLMHAVGQFALANYDDIKVAYVSGEMFTNQFITALREHRTSEFRRNLRGVDLWLVDDIQFITGRERTEEEFFHTYNSLYDMGKQIILTSDRSPKELDLDTRLLSRFEAGMLADIKPPDLETRMAIIQRKAQIENIELPNDVVLYISRLITSNIRQLEGALIKLHAHAALMRLPLNIELAEEVLGSYFDTKEQPTIDILYIQKATAKHFQVDLAALSGKSRSQEIVIPRQVSMYLCRELLDTSLPNIGKAFGGRDHSTVLHSCKAIDTKLKSDKDFAVMLEELSLKIKEGKAC